VQKATLYGELYSSPSSVFLYAPSSCRNGNLYKLHFVITITTTTTTTTNTTTATTTITLLKGEDIVRFIKSQRISWFGHVEEWKRMLKGRLYSRRRKGRSRMRWLDDVEVI
jgi:hypothetical protein